MKVHEETQGMHIKPYFSTLEERFPFYQNDEDAGLSSGMAYCAEHPRQTVLYTDLPTSDIEGFPIYVNRQADGVLQATFHPNTHALVIGSTGSGKTTGFVLPFLNWMPLKKNKPSIIVSDPKNELNYATVNRFIEQGYRVLWYNFQDYTVSDCWNPLTKIYRMYQKYLHVKHEVRTTWHQDGPTYTFLGTTYTNQKDLQAATEAEADMRLAEVSNMIGTMAATVAPVQNDKDPYWDQISATYLCAFLWAMLEDSAEGKITENEFTFDTIISKFDSFSNTTNSYEDHGYFSNRPSSSQAYQLAYSSIINLSASTTRACIISSFSQKIAKFRDTSIRRITRTTTLDMNTLDDGTPTVIFVSYKDEDSLHYEIISMLIADLYTTLIAIARSKGGRLDRPFYFLLDEFGNFPKFHDFEHVISACRSRDIWFLLVVQSYAQLERVYGKDTSTIIIDNLNMHLFFGSCNYETKQAFSRECGTHTVFSPLSAINGTQKYIERYEKEGVPLIPISHLGHLEDGECIITKMRGDVIRSYIERSYLCPEYNNGMSRLRNRRCAGPAG